MPEQPHGYGKQGIFKMITLKITAILAICTATFIALASTELGPDLVLTVLAGLV
jgi:hypothetical protein